ncbi:VENN motif pre-toxin domain-containing protein [Erwinia sp. JH02]|nr:VENN motif pre-toxin domain-containing protein [Erwinia sp. JH02]
MTGSASVNLSRDKMHSNYDSVVELTGIFAGKGGFDVTVGEHTQLNGAVIGATATADNNRLDTGTLGFSDIHNRADYKVEHQSIGLSTGGSIGGQAIGNMANTLLAGVNKDGHDSGTTKAAVSEGTLLIRDQDKQAQDVANLSRDAENANGSISQIFDKEKEQKRIQQAQLIGEISTQVSDIVRTQGAISAAKDARDRMGSITDADRDQAQKDWVKAHPGQTPDENAINGQVYQNFYDQAFNATGLGTGGAVQQGIQAATAVVQGLAGGDIAAAIANGSAPYLAEAIGHRMGIDNNPEAKAVAHAIVGAALAAAQGQNAAAGATGAALGEITAGILKDQLYGDTPVADLTETQKQTLSALATLSSGLAGGLAGDSTGSAVYAAQAGKTTAENNTLYADDAKVRQDTKWLLPHLEGEKKQQADKLIANLNAKDLAFDEAIDKACQNLSSEQCRGMRQTLSEMGKSYDKSLDGEYIATMRAVYKDDAGKADGQIWKYANADAKAQRVADIQKLAAIHEISPQMAEILYDTMAGIHTTAAIGGTIYGLKGAGVPATASKSTTSLVDAEKAALERIAQNAKNTKDLSTKQPNTLLIEQEKKTLSQTAEKILTYNRTGSGLKADPSHRSSSFLSKEQLEAGKVFTIVGGDGIKRTLLQANGSFNGGNGIFEYIVDPSGSITHQRFISGGVINGMPNQRVKK